jgi:hypothetical protein
MFIGGNDKQGEKLKKKLVAYFKVLNQYLLKDADWFYPFTSPTKILYEYSAIPMRSTCRVSPVYLD